MSDAQTTVAELLALQRRFVNERDWAPFHTPKNLAMAVSVEAAELLELFLWVREGEAVPSRSAPDPARVEEEVADVAICLLNLVNALGLDLSEAVRKKALRNGEKYPAEEVRGSAEKYDAARRGALKPSGR